MVKVINMLYACERCKKLNPKMEKCDYCNRLVCESCTKSSKRSEKTKKLFICKDCWSNMVRRSKFKSA